MKAKRPATIVAGRSFCRSGVALRDVDARAENHYATRRDAASTEIERLLCA
jgi:hypothetical protein